MPHFTDIAIIYNPNSTGNAEDMAKEIKRELKTALPDISCALLTTQSAGHATELAYDFATNHQKPLIISSSGDGGYNEVINGLLTAQQEGATPIAAVLPAGNANDHARTMHDLPLIDLIKQGAVTELDILKITTKHTGSPETSRYAHSYIGLGLTPTVAVELNKHTLNSFRESLIVIKTFWNLRPVRIITSEGKHHELDSLICSLIPEMAKVLTISEKAKPRDGLFEVTTFEHNHKLKLLFRLARGVVKSLGAQNRTDQFGFSVVSPTPIQLDGEVMELKAQTEVDVSICPRLLKTVVSV
jgi:diacylglycerol kinase (ATP)